MSDILDIFDQLDGTTTKTVLRTPFGWPGGKSRSIKPLLEHVPYGDAYTEPFGGSGALLLARRPSRLEVFNDRHSGVTAFYRCIRDRKLLDALIKRLRLTVYSKEEFTWCKETWENVLDPVERAARWYYMIRSSFSQLGRNWGRATSGIGVGHRITSRIKLFNKLHSRLRKVQIENNDWKNIVEDYDGPNTVHYLDPPYLLAHAGTYKYELTTVQHKELLDTIFNLKGTVALSGFECNMYDEYDWDDTYTWGSFTSVLPGVATLSNHKITADLTRSHQTEKLWIKRAK